MISNCGSDEKGKYYGGKAGDQTGKEWILKSWYNRPWKCVLRYKGNADVNVMISNLAIQSAKNNNIGYDQWQRATYWKELQNAEYHPENIKTKCEADCSAGVMAIVKATGYRLDIPKLKTVSEKLVCRQMREALKKVGFEVLTESKYLTSEKYLQAGDILLNDTAHTAIAVGTGKVLVLPSKIEQEKPKKKTDDTYIVQPNDNLWKIAVLKLGKGSRYREIMELNKLESDIIHVGQVLKIPSKN